MRAVSDARSGPREAVARGGPKWRIRALARGVRGFLFGPPPPRPPRPTPEILPAPPSEAPGVPELVRAAPRRSVHTAYRLNLIIPSITGPSTFGGIQTAIDLFRSVSDGGVRRRLISVASLDDATGRSFADFRIVDPSEDSAERSQLVALGVPVASISDGSPGVGAEEPPDARPRTIPIGPRDVFIATFWPTALFALDVRAWQTSTYGSAPKSFAYLIQDFEPGFYARSASYLLSSSTYCQPESTVAIFNTSLLQREFHEAGLRFASEFSFEPRLAPALRAALAAPPRSRSRTIVVYGRPSKPRNGFGLIVEGLRAWRAATPDASDWRIVSAGEPHPDVDIGGGVVLRSIGKLTMDAYAELLRTSAIGIALMISSHPSYPPLEMSHLGLLVLTNSFGEKDLSTWHPNIRSLRQATPAGLAADLADLCRRFDADSTAGDRARPSTTAFLDPGRQFPFVDDLARLLEAM